MNTAKKPKALRECVRSLLNWKTTKNPKHENGKEVQKAEKIIKQIWKNGQEIQYSRKMPKLFALK